MRVFRRVLGVLFGYVIFAASAVLLFRLSGRDPHVQQDAAFVVGSIAYGMFFAAVGGYVSGAVGGGRARNQAIWTGVIIALGATVSLLAGPKAGSLWSKVGALVLMAPSTTVGGMIRERWGGRASPTERA